MITLLAEKIWSEMLSYDQKAEGKSKECPELGLYLLGIQ